ncbi:hypothetical protein TrST_g10123 [Triparma strigata]|uniref:Phosphoglycerate mutase n=1 Tax=Triparma strigata TaxID=1606541 RepID=A0A9W7E4G4_9STRA|nr:hypothetical protein TrST_g10123 [Triparma strigata]
MLTLIMSLLASGNSFYGQTSSCPCPTRTSVIGHSLSSSSLSAAITTRRNLIIGGASALSFKVVTGAVVYKALTTKPYKTYDELKDSDSYASLESSADTEALNLAASLGPVKQLVLPPLSKDATRIVVVRHGRTYMNRLKICRGTRIDDEIDPLGKFQAQRTGLALSGISFDAAYESTLLRSQQTLQIISPATSKSKSNTATNLLNEVDYGELEGLQNVKPICSAPFGEHFGGETVPNLNKRADDALALMLKGNEGKTVLAVSHGAFITTLLRRIAKEEGGDSEADNFLFLKNCSINVIDVDSKTGKATIKLVNSYDHLST